MQVGLFRQIIQLARPLKHFQNKNIYLKLKLLKNYLSDENDKSKKNS